MTMQKYGYEFSEEELSEEVVGAEQIKEKPTGKPRRKPRINETTGKDADDAPNDEQGL